MGILKEYRKAKERNNIDKSLASLKKDLNRSTSRSTNRSINKSIRTAYKISKSLSRRNLKNPSR